MKKTLLLILASLIFIEPCSAAIHIAATCENKAGQTDVQTAVSAAAAGDTVYVPSGACSWTSTVTAQLGIKIMGPGPALLTITNNIGSGEGLFYYNPADFSLDQHFRISGFTFDLNDLGHGIVLGPKNGTHGGSIIPQTNIRIDHNTFKNATLVGSHVGIYVHWGMYGVVDNNIFQCAYSARHDGFLAGSYWWESFTWTPGTKYAMYFEDNIFEGDTTTITDGQASGGPYVIRYNSITLGGNPNPLIDAHGNSNYGTGKTGATDGMYSTIGAEIYGNDVLLNSKTLYLFFHQRGAKARVFFNRTDGTSFAVGKPTEEYTDDEEPLTNPAKIQHVNDSYYWSNRHIGGAGGEGTVNPTSTSYTSTGVGDTYIDKADDGNAWTTRYGVRITSGADNGDFRQVDEGSTNTRVPVVSAWTINPSVGDTFNVVGDCCNQIVPDVTYWKTAATFTGVSGVGCGTLAARPATCIAGVAYWATNQSCTDLAGVVGRNPSTPIAGTLYKCTATNTWTVYYEPYEYPHPLRARLQKYAPFNR
jgi:hypothetical protein